MDNLSRVLATRLGKEWGQSVLVVNKTGANEIIGAEFCGQSPADGYTLFAATEAALTMNPHLYKKLPYNPEKDFTPSRASSACPWCSSCPRPPRPTHLLKEFIELAKTPRARR